MSAPPPPVCDLALRLGAREDAAPTLASFSQRGRLRQDADSRWITFRARQVTSVQLCEFTWRAAMGPLGMVRVHDALEGASGRLRARLFGLVPLASAAGPQATRGQAMRYLAELPWCPDAILHNRSIRWEVAASNHMIASVELGMITAAVDLHLDAEGRIAAISAPDRPRSIGKGFVDTPWWGRFADFRETDGRIIPFSGEVGWEIGGEKVTVWQGELTEWLPIDW